MDVQATTTAVLGDACYSVTTTNGAGELTWRQPLVCASDYGSGAGVTYVGPCDASAPSTTVTLELVSLVDATGAPLDPADYQNPCPPGIGCSRTVECVEGGDTPVRFDLTVMVRRERGFVDMAVSVDYLSCAAKLDCVDAAGAPLQLLFNEAGVRDQTVVLALECYSQACIDPAYLYTEDIVIVCDDGFAVIAPTSEGALPFTTTGPDVYAAKLFRGQEPYGEGQYHNVAIGIRPGKNCRLTTAATLSDVAFSGGVSPSSHPIVEWDVRLTDAAGNLACGRHPLDREPAGVSTVYTAEGAPYPFPYEIAYPAPPECATGELVCATPDEWAACEFCDEANSMGCPGTDPATCRTVVLNERSADPDCTALYDAYLRCMASDITTAAVCAGGALGVAPSGAMCGPEVSTWVACLSAACGNGVLEAGEYCDDGNTTDGDGCSSLCKPD